MPPTSMNNKGIRAPFRNALQLGMAMRQICQMRMLPIFLLLFDHLKKIIFDPFLPILYVEPCACEF